jgi:mediator of RNA polymerase II transcription subunit 18, fungi type
MHELFLISDCADEDVIKATKLLQGFCEMAPVPIINRRLIWTAPHVPKQKGFDQQFLMRQPQMKLPLWRSLQEGLTRQAYHVNLVYGISRDQFGGPEVSDEMSEERQPWVISGYTMIVSKCLAGRSMIFPGLCTGWTGQIPRVQGR